MAENVHEDDGPEREQRIGDHADTKTFPGLNPRHGSGLSVPDDETTTQSESTNPVDLKSGERIMLKLNEPGDQEEGWKELKLVSRYRKGREAKLKDQSKAKSIWWKAKHDDSESIVDLRGAGLIWKKKHAQDNNENSTMFVT